MAFNGGGGTGFTFGSNNNNNTGSTFGGFGGSSNNNAGGFGSTSTGGGFGSSTAPANPTNPFGGSTFGSGSGSGGGAAFGSNNNNSTSLFGNKPASTTGGLFGSSTSTTGGSGLFSNTNNNNNPSGAFGSSTGAFGNNNNNTPTAFGGGSSNAFGGFGSQGKPGFGASTSSTPLFGQGGQGTTGGFGSGAFGGGASGTALSNQPVPPSNGTLNPEFQAVVDKEANGSTNSYQSITMMPAYNKYSFEELRLADYNAGRIRGNGSTQGAGAFGSSTFGGFNQSNNGGTFVAANSNPFGSSTTASGGFGNNTATTFNSGAGGLFGSGSKPAAGGLFGQQSSGTSSGGLFGTSNNQQPASNPFGSSFGANNNTSGGLFGNNNQNQTQQKPGLFGNTTSTPNAGTSLFGNTSNTNTTGGGLFGNTNQQQQQQQSGGLFGNNNQNQQKPSLFGNSTSGGFGTPNTQGQTSGGLFGTSTTSNAGGGLFGNNSSTNTGGGLFGNTNNQQQNNTGGGLFGNSSNNASKPGGLFGNSTFGNNNQQSSGGGLFSNTSTNNQQSGGLFGNANNNNNNAGGFSFGNANQNKPTTSLFGNTSSNQSGGLFGSGNNNNTSLFGNSQSNQQQNQQQQEQFKHSSLLDPNPYGQSSIWTGLPQPNMENSKPLVTPLTATQKLKESQAKPPPSLRLNQSRYMTPPKRSGFGFSYSNYGTPNSAASTPGGNGLSNSMYGSRFTGGSFGRSMGKAASVNSLRTQYLDGESVLSPGAFAPSASRYSSGSIRRLTIDKSIRNDLFTRPPLPPLLGDKATTNGATSSQSNASGPRDEPAPETSGRLKKRVSFEKDVTGGTNGALNGETGALVRTENDDDNAIDDSRSSSAPNGVHKGNELAAVPEDRESEAVFSKKKTSDAAKPDPKPGDYWMKPTRAELRQVPRDKMQNFRNFEVGRVGCGKVIFNDPVDLTQMPLDDLYENIIEIRLRSVTVYPDGTKKPKQGQGLNVPSTIFIENSWPRSRGQVSSITSGPAFDKHVNRLKKIPGTTFVSYEPETGVWTFKVPHYTRYGLDYDDEDADDFRDSQLPTPPDPVQQLKSADASVMEVDSDEYDSSGQDDTFALQSQRQKTVPGGFGRQATIEDDDMEDRSLIPAPKQDDSSEHSFVSEDEVSDDGMDMAGSYPAPMGPVLNLDSPIRPSFRARAPGTPGRALLDLDGDWAEQLQRTISPRKQNRDVLREAQSKVLLDRAYEPIKPASRKNEFRSSIDVMNAIFGNEGRTRRGQREAEPEFEFPYAKRAKTFDQGAQEMSDDDKAWHSPFKPNFTGRSQLICKTMRSPASAEWNADVLARSDRRVISIGSLKDDQQKVSIPRMMAGASINLIGEVPKIDYTHLPFSTLKERLSLVKCSGQEGTLYELLHVLFDTYEDEYSYEFTEQQRQDYEHRIRKDRLSKFLSTVLASQTYPLSDVNNAAGAAFQHLTAHNIHAACETLMKAKNFNLAMLVAQVESADATFQDDMADQIAAWKDQNVASEMTEEIRSLYELLSGNTTICQGKQNGPTEDRATTFLVSEKYDLSWLQAFGLCFWYGHTKHDNIEDIVTDFAHKVSDGEESASPVLADGKEDPMWVILKLYTSWRKAKAAAVPTFPIDLSALSKPFDVSSTFSLFQAIIRALQGAYPRVDPAMADQLVADYAFQLEAGSDFVGSMWALTHLRDNIKRGEMMVDLMCRHAEKLDAPPNHLEEVSAQFTVLTKTLKVPESWICQAKALFCRSINRWYEELHYLILAKEWEEAHDCLCRRVAPRLVVDEDYDMLRDIVSAFGEKPDEVVQGWGKGGQVYSDLVSVVGKTRIDVSARKAALSRLQSSLSGMGTRLAQTSTEISAGGLEELEERVAVKEMSRTVANLLEEDDATTKKILELPLTAEVKGGLANKMAAEYYRKVMGGGR